MKAAFDPNARKRPVNLTRNEDLVDSAVTDVNDSVEADAPCGNIVPAGVRCLPSVHATVAHTLWIAHAPSHGRVGKHSEDCHNTAKRAAALAEKFEAARWLHKA